MALTTCPECGKEVSSTAESCPNCGYGIKKHFDAIQNAKIREETLKQLEIRRAKNSKILKIVLPIAIVVIIIGIGLGVNSFILSERMVFESDDEMIEYLTQCRNWKLDNDYRNDWLVFHKSGFCEEISEEYSNWGDKIEMQPTRGTFKFQSSKYVISKTGDIVEYNKNYGDKYYKLNNFYPSVETSADAFQLENISANSTDNILEAEFSLKNTGKRTYDFIQLEISLEDKDGNTHFLEHYYTISTEKENNSYQLAPGETGTCKVRTYNEDSKYTKISASLASYDSVRKY